MREKSYIEGFMAKCAEFGVDPEALVKTAAEDEGGLINPDMAKQYGAANLATTAHGVGQLGQFANRFPSWAAASKGPVGTAMRFGAKHLPTIGKALPAAGTTMGKLMGPLAAVGMEATAPTAGAAGGWAGSKGRPVGKRLQEAGRGWTAGARNTITGGLVSKLNTPKNAPPAYDDKKRRAAAATNKDKADKAKAGE